MWVDAARTIDFRVEHPKNVDGDAAMWKGQHLLRQFYSVRKSAVLMTILIKD